MYFLNICTHSWMLCLSVIRFEYQERENNKILAHMSCQTRKHCMNRTRFISFSFSRHITCFSFCRAWMKSCMYSLYVWKTKSFFFSCPFTPSRCRDFLASTDRKSGPLAGLYALGNKTTGFWRGAVWNIRTHHQHWLWSICRKVRHI